MIQTQENNEKPYFEPDLGPLDLNSGRKFSDGQTDGQECFDRTLPD